LADAMTARALALALDPDFDEDTAAGALSSCGCRPALAHALSRIDRDLFDDPTAVPDRAARALARALERV
jgi:hypothetical protein